MPKWYRLNGSGSWVPTNRVYRLNGSGIWTKIKTIYRLNGSGEWGIVHSDSGVPVATTSPILSNQNFDTTIFYGGDTLTLTRGEYTETTEDTNTTYRMRIYKGTNASLPLSDSSWIVAASANYNGSNSDELTQLTYSLTDTDAKNGYYLVGEVRVNNDANTVGAPTYDFETSPRVLSRISFTVSNLSVTPSSTGGTFSWSVGGVADSSFIYSQTLTIRLTDGTLKNTQSIVPGTTTAVVNDPTNISPSTIYSATIEVIANDGWKLTATPNSLTDVEPFTTLAAAPVNTVPPTIGPLNNRGYLPVSTSLTATNGTWSNVGVGTTYLYDWWLEDSVTGAVTNTGYISNNTQSYILDNVSDFLFVRVKATNSDGGFGTATSITYTLDQAVAVSTVTPTSATLNVATNFSFSISHYPTSYIIDWGDGTSNSESISANTSTVNKTISHTYTSTGNKTVTVTAQPGNKTSITAISVAPPTPTVSNVSLLDTTTTPSQASGISVSGSTSNIATISWTNGSPITSLSVAYSGAGTTGSPHTDTTSPFDTSITRSYTSSGTISVTVTTTNNNKQASISWNMANASSYAITYTISGIGSVTDYGNATTFVNYPITLGSVSRTITLNSITAYSGQNQTGISNTYNFTSSVTPTDKSSLASGSGSVTYYVAPPVNTSLPTLAPSSIAVGTQLTAGVGSWSNSPTSYDIRIYRGTQNVAMFETLVASGTGLTLNYTVTQADYDSGQRYFRTFVNATNAGGSSGFVAGQERGPIAAPTTYTVTWNANGGSVSPTSSSGVSGTLVSAPTPTRPGYTFLYWRDTPSGDYLYQINPGGSWTIFSNITFYARWQLNAGTAPSTPTGLVNTYSSGPSWTGSWNASSGTTPITYYWTLYQSQSNGGAITATASGSTTGTSFTRSMSSANGLWAYFTVYASNSAGTSGTATSSWA